MDPTQLPGFHHQLQGGSLSQGEITASAAVQKTGLFYKRLGTLPNHSET